MAGSAWVLWTADCRGEADRDRHHRCCER